MEFSITNLNGAVPTMQSYAQRNIYANGSITIGGVGGTIMATVIQAGSLQTMTLDWFGTLTSNTSKLVPGPATVQVSIMALEPQTLTPVATLVAGAWSTPSAVTPKYIGPERLLASGPVGVLVGVQIVMITGSSPGPNQTNTLDGLTMTAVQATGGR